jgi:phosphatidylglycerol:prolipoprotein diacylglycerol transferase
MNRIAFSIFGFNIYYYSLCILCGIIVAYFLITKESKKHNIKKDDIIDLIFYGILIGLAGARIYYVLFNLDYYLNNPSQILAVWNGGLAIHGGLIAGAIFVYIYSKKKNINFLRILDIIAPPIMIAQSFGRWGNFFNKEAYGSITTYITLKKMHIPKFIIKEMYIDGNYHYPTFLFESIWCLICAIIIILIRKRKNIKLGITSGLYLILYGIGRFFIEILRTDSLMLFGLKVAQIVSIFSIILGVILIIISKNQEKYLEEA